MIRSSGQKFFRIVLKLLLKRNSLGGFDINASAENQAFRIDGVGTQAYSYDQLSRLTSETRTFTGVGSFTVGYDYNLAGELKRLTDAANSTTNYSFDATGRLNGVTGSDNLVGGVAVYASNFSYRAFGGLKTMTDGSSHTSTLLYNSRQQPTHFDLSGGVTAQNYDCYNDGRVSVVHNTTDANFDRSYSYDHTGRLIEAKSGAQVNNIPNVGVPYYETFGYDAFSNLGARASDSSGIIQRH